jgi:hypothetical protein
LELTDGAKGLRKPVELLVVELLALSVGPDGDVI